MQSEQTRQGRQERKRLKREEKQRRLQGSLSVEGPALPRIKMSDTLLDYVRPLIDALPADAGLEKLKKLLQLAATVWNAMGQEVGDPDEAALKVVAEMKSKFHLPPPVAVIDWLAVRRLLRFGDDPRLVLSVDVVRDGDRIRVVADSAIV